jgi:hypothetical protein
VNISEQGRMKLEDLQSFITKMAGIDSTAAVMISK